VKAGPHGASSPKFITSNSRRVLAIRHDLTAAYFFSGRDDLFANVFGGHLKILLTMENK